MKIIRFFIVLCAVLFTAEVICASPFLSISTTEEDIKEGNEVAFSYRLQNTGETPLEHLFIIDSLPRGIEFVSSNALLYNKEGNVLSFEVGKLDIGESYQFEVILRCIRVGKIDHRLRIEYKETERELKKIVHTVHRVTVRRDIPFNDKSLRCFMSPNGDGINDFFIIKGLEEFPSNEIVVFNRFNDRVFSTVNYDNSWDGGKLPSGFYYFILTIKFPDGKMEKHSGSIVIEK